MFGLYTALEAEKIKQDALSGIEETNKILAQYSGIKTEKKDEQQ